MPVGAIPSQVTFDLLAKVVSARFLLCEVTIFPLKSIYEWMDYIVSLFISSNFHLHILVCINDY